ncbi:MAG: CHAT domain-containing protein [Nocardioidaceae bacterium]
MAAALDPDRLQADVERARSTYWRGRPASARRQYLALLARLDREGAHTEIRVRALVGLAATSFEVTGALADALGYLTEAERHTATPAARSLTVSVMGQRALILLRAGDVAEALAVFNGALRHLPHSPAEDQVALLLNRGVVLLEGGELAGARDSFSRAAAIASESGLEILAAKALHNEAYADFLAGQIPRALALMDEAEAMFGDENLAVSSLDRARVLREAGLIRDAEALLARAAEQMARGRLLQDLGETALVQAECALLRGNAKQARAFTLSALRRFTRRDNQRWQRNAELMLLRCDRRLADEKGSVARRRALLALAERADRLAGVCEAEERADLAREARLIQAGALLRAGQEAPSSPPVQAGDPMRIRLHTREVKALAAMNAGDRARARTEVRRGLAELGSYQNRFGSLDLRTAAAVHGGALARLHLEIALDDGRPGAVFNAIEEVRAVSTRLPSVRPPSDERTASLLSELRQVQEEERALQGESASAVESRRLRQRAVDLQDQIRARAWELEGEQGGSGRGATVGDVRRGLGTQPCGDGAFVSYARHQGEWLAVLATPRRTTLHRLGEVARVDGLVQRARADLDALSMPALPPPLVTAVRSSLDTTLEQLDQILLTPLGRLDLPLAICVSGMLTVLPWSMLPSRVGHPVVVTPSATSWLRSAGESRPADAVVVALAGPGLFGAADEAVGVAATWKHSRAITGEAATIAAAREALAGADLVHFAAHGHHQQESPLFSSLRLADGDLFAYELDAESRIAPCVALSACEAGLTTVRPGDEALGLTSVLLQLGTRSVLAGIAKVRDDVAAAVMLEAHRQLSAGIDTATSLAQAQVACAQWGVPAPFVCFGAAW